MGERFALIGAGRVGRALAEALFHRGWKCVAVISRHQEQARILAARVEAAVAEEQLSRLPENFSHLFICTPDDQLSAISSQLHQLHRQWDHIFIAHTSGTHSSLILQPLAERGASVASLHPAMSFTGAAGEWQKLIGGLAAPVGFALEGDAAAQSSGRKVLAVLEASYILLSPEQKTLYHVACVLVANYLVTLHAQAEALLQRAGVTEGRALLQNLSRTVLDNLAVQPTAAALTGPIARGETSVIEAHLRLLIEQFPSMLPLYRELGKATLELARKGGDRAMEADQKISEFLTNLMSFDDRVW